MSRDKQTIRGNTIREKCLKVSFSKVPWKRFELCVTPDEIEELLDRGLQWIEPDSEDGEDWAGG